MHIHVGLKWQSPDGLREVVGIEPGRDDCYVVRTEGAGYIELHREESIHRMMHRDAANLEHRLTEAEREKEALEAEQQHINGFDDGMSPMHKGRVRAILSRKVRYRGRALSRLDLIAQKINAGAFLTAVDGETVLMSPDETYLDSKAVTKTGIEYARYLISIWRDAEGSEQ